jgi:hypothetical protein
VTTGTVSALVLINTGPINRVAVADSNSGQVSVNYKLVNTPLAQPDQIRYLLS